MRQQRTQRTFPIIAAAATVAIGAAARAGVTGGSGQEFTISTSGATALSAFTRAGDGVTLNRGPYSLGQGSLLIGGSTYTLDANGQRLGIGLRNNPLTNEPPTSADRLVYNYHEIGSVNGVIDVARAGNLLPAGSFAISSGNPFWHMGTRLNAEPSAGSVLTNGYTWQGKQPVRVAWSDVRAEQAFSIAGSANFNARPTQPGYGLGRNLPGGGTNFQQLTPSGDLVGGVDPSTTRLRNEGVAVVPFTVSANPGTGLAKLAENEAQFLQATGRLPNGANFNNTTRDIGSGTRNQKANNLRLDPSWASGERDHVNAQGQDVDPFTFTRNSDRPSAEHFYADKTSGSSRLRNSIIHSRMALGVLSSGDVGSRGRSTTSTEPLRVLAVDWDDTGEPAGAVAGFVQPTLQNVVEGKYQMWSAAQAVTVAPYANPVANDTGANAYKPIQGDANDQSVGNPTSAAQPGVHRKFLDNIRNSVANFGNPETNQTPFDAVAAASFIPTSVMAVDKQFDGDVQSARTRSAAEEAAYNTLLGQDPTVSTNLIGALNWANASNQNGNLGSNSMRYNVFAPGNNGLSDTVANSNASADLSVDIEARTVLAGDFNGDAVRDLADVAALALAYANPGVFLTTPATGDPNGRNYNGQEVASVESPTVSKPALAFAAGQEGLVVLADLNGNGNVTPTGSLSGSVASVERADVRYFLYGAAVDTSGFTGAAAKREDGVRLGQLRKNQAIDTYNATLDGFVGSVNNPATNQPFTQVEVNALKFDKFDVNNDGLRNRADAIVVDRNVGKNYTNLADVLSTYDDLVAAELDDNNAITHVLASGTSDFKLLRDALGAALLNGDADFSGTVNLGDFNILAANFGQAVDRWSKADFDFSGVVNLNDFNLLAANFGMSAAGPTVTPEDWAALGSAVPEPGAAALVLVGAIALVRRRRRD